MNEFIRLGLLLMAWFFRRQSHEIDQIADGDRIYHGRSYFREIGCGLVDA